MLKEMLCVGNLERNVARRLNSNRRPPGGAFKKKKKNLSTAIHFPVPGICFMIMQFVLCIKPYCANNG